MSNGSRDSAAVLVSTDADGNQGNGGSFDLSISDNNRYVAFQSFASNLVPGRTSSVGDIFVKDLWTGEVAVASTDADGTQGNGGHLGPSISATGRYVAFTSEASNLLPDDPNTTRDIYVKDLRTGELALASANFDGEVGNGASFGVSISDNGRYAAISSEASNLTLSDGNGSNDVFVKDLRTGEVTLASADAGGSEGNSFSNSPSISANGRYVAFQSLASNLVPGDTNGNVDVFIKDLRTDEVRLVSTGSDGNQGNGSSLAPSVSGNGRYVAFTSFASNLVPGDTNGDGDVFVKDLRTGELTIVSVNERGNEGNDSSFTASISDNGRYVAFNSTASNLVLDDTNGEIDIFLRDLRTGELTLVSADPEGNVGNLNSGSADVTDEGVVAFASRADNLVPGDANGVFDIFVWS